MCTFSNSHASSEGSPTQPLKGKPTYMWSMSQVLQVWRLIAIIQVICLIIDRRSLKNHVKTHSIEKPYQCTICNYSCKLVSTLKKHWDAIQVHNLQLFVQTFFNLKETYVKTHWCKTTQLQWVQLFSCKIQLSEDARWMFAHKIDICSYSYMQVEKQLCRQWEQLRLRWELRTHSIKNWGRTALRGEKDKQTSQAMSQTRQLSTKVGAINIFLNIIFFRWAI